MQNYLLPIKHSFGYINYYKIVCDFGRTMFLNQNCCSNPGPFLFLKLTL